MSINKVETAKKLIRNVNGFLVDNKFYKQQDNKFNKKKYVKKNLKNAKKNTKTKNKFKIR